MILNGMNITLGSSIQTIGGILAENKMGTMELDLTFEELLRTHEDEIQNFLLERLMN
jgi:vacuolar-type H+-ATPase subunit E/Vma4